MEKSLQRSRPRQREAPTGQVELARRAWDQGVAELGAGAALARTTARQTWGYRPADPLTYR